jgi:DNA-binding PadR family transcriptional regulator
MARRLGMSTVAVLAAVERGARYGLDISQETGLLPGTVYTTLRRLERRQWLDARWEDAEVAARERRPRRRYYTLRKEGAEALANARKRLGHLAHGIGLELPVSGEAD